MSAVLVGSLVPKRSECMGPIQFGHGYRSLHLRDDFGYVQELGLDAPVYLPRGSHRVNIIHETGSRWFFTDGFTHHRELL